MKDSEESPPSEVAVTRKEWLVALTCCVVLVWINAYICRDLFWTDTAKMNSMHGFWIALAEQGITPWLGSNWWPYWDCGIPFQFTYAPLVPVLTAVWAGVGRVPHAIAFQSLTASIYCLAPLTLFVMGWRLTRAPAYAFAGALFYSLTAPTQLLIPDSAFSWSSFWDSRRLYLMAVWDDTPHFAALALLPVVVVCLVASLRHRRARYYVPTIVFIALMAAASEFGMMEAVMAAICLLFVFRRYQWRQNLAITAALGGCAYALIAPFFSPSLLLGVSSASQSREPSLGLPSLTAAALIVVGWVILWQYLPRWTKDWQLQFFAYFAYLTTNIPLLAVYLHRPLLPQPERYKAEMELAWALLLVFGLRGWFQRIPKPLKVSLVCLVSALAAEQVASHRRFAKAILQPGDVSSSIEYRVSRWVEQNLNGARVMLPGSIAQWANTFTMIPQFSGSSWSRAMNPVQQQGLAAIYNGGPTPDEDALASLVWLQAFGVGAVAISGPKSQETWKPYAHPGKFDGVLPLLWRQDDVAIYRVPQRTASLAHVLPRQAFVSHAPRSIRDIAEMERYASALADPQAPIAESQWDGPNRLYVRANAQPGQLISVQVSYHSGWHAHAEGMPVAVHRDGLGLLWLDPGCHGRCEVQLDYDGGWELRITRWISFIAFAALLFAPPLWRRI